MICCTAGYGVEFRAPLGRAGDEVDGAAVVGSEFLVEAAQHVADGATDVLAVDDLVVGLDAVEAEELDVRAREEVLRVLPQHEQTEHGRDGVVARCDHLGGGKLLLAGAVVGVEHLARDGLGQVLVLEVAKAEVVECGRGNALDVERGVGGAAALVEDALILRGGETAPRPDPDVDGAAVADRGVSRRVPR